MKLCYDSWKRLVQLAKDQALPELAEEVLRLDSEAVRIVVNTPIPNADMGDQIREGLDELLSAVKDNVDEHGLRLTITPHFATSSAEGARGDAPVGLNPTLSAKEEVDFKVRVFGVKMLKNIATLRRWRPDWEARERGCESPIERAIIRGKLEALDMVLELLEG